MSRTADVSSKVAKQIAYQIDLAKTSNTHGLPFGVSVAHLTELIAAQTRQPPAHVTTDVKAELEALVEGGTLHRWLDHFGPSTRADRADHYVISALLPPRNR